MTQKPTSQLRKPTLWLVAMLAIAAGVWPALTRADEPSVAPSAPSQFSRAFFEKQLEREMNRYDAAKAEQQTIQDLKQRLTSQKASLANIQMDNLDGAISDLLSAARDLQGAGPKVDSAASVFANRYQSLFRRFRAPLEKAYSSFEDAFQNLDRSTVQKYFRGFDLPDVRENLNDAIPKASSLFQIVTSKSSQIPQGLVTEVIEELSSKAPEALKKSFNEQSQAFKTYTDQLLDSLNAKYDAQTKQIDESQQAERTANEGLVKLDAGQQAALVKKGELDKSLVTAVYFMIGSIVLIFLSLRIFPEKLAGSIITERTMIELLSMGFLLLTVIILATGEQLAKEAVGTLLGTIAGYIFGRKVSEPITTPGERRAKLDTHEAHEAPVKEGLGAVKEGLGS